MSKEEINGFLVDKFNQHGLKEGAAQGTCPLCSSDRKPKNAKAQCASYDWERGLGTCHNCDTTFQLHTYQRKGASERVYTRPVTPEQFNEVSTNVAPAPRDGEPAQTAGNTNTLVDDLPF